MRRWCAPHHQWDAHQPHRSTKGTDHIDGGNYDTDLTDVINGQYDFSRLTDTRRNCRTSRRRRKTCDGGPNGTCEANLGIGSGGISRAAPRSHRRDGAGHDSSRLVGHVPSGSSVSLAGDTVASVTASTITLNEAPTTGTGSRTPTLYFPGHPPVLAVSNLDG